MSIILEKMSYIWWVETEKTNIVQEAAIDYKRSGVLNTGSRTILMKVIRGGVEYDKFQSIAVRLPFSMEDWAHFLHLSERTIQRYKKEERTWVKHLMNGW